MAGSVAEERIREKAEAALRRARPDARIIHELVLRQGGERIDLAAVWPDGMILAEVKSEKDTLTRLQAQMRAATALECEVWLCLAEKWREPVKSMRQISEGYAERPLMSGGRQIGVTHVALPNPMYVPELNRVLVRHETDDGLEGLDGLGYALYAARLGGLLNGAALLDMLWADELRGIAGLGGRATRGQCIAHVRELFTGREIRRAACAALRARTFPRADPPVTP